MIMEIATFQLKESVIPADPSSPASKSIREYLTQELNAHGAHNAYYGQFIEKPETAIVFVNWDSVDDNKVFMSSP